MRAVSAAMDIEATPRQIWAVLADHSSCAGWDPLIRRPCRTSAHEGYEIRWTGRLLVPGVLDREHVVDLTDDGDGTTRVVQSITFRGLLAPVAGMRAERTGEALAALNRALRNQVEEGRESREAL